MVPFMHMNFPHGGWVSASIRMIFYASMLGLLAYVSWNVYDVIYPINRIDSVTMLTPEIVVGTTEMKARAVITRRIKCKYTAYRILYKYRDIPAIITESSAINDSAVLTRDIVFIKELKGLVLPTPDGTGYKIPIEYTITLPPDLPVGRYEIGGFLNGVCEGYGGEIKFVSQGIYTPFTIIPKPFTETNPDIFRAEK